eukprot:g24398.t1
MYVPNLADLLGVSPDATTAQIGKAYRLQARKHHPDKGGNEDLFKKITHAYDVLNDEKKRKLYDQYGEEGLKDGGPGAGGGFGGFHPFADLFGHRGPQGPVRTDDIQYKLAVTLSQMYQGATRKLNMKRDEICSDCQGRGSAREGAVATCDVCHGRGVQMVVRQIGPGMLQQMQMRCNKCHGQKEIINERDKCRGCKGMKVVKKERILEVHVDKGACQGDKIKFREMADQAPDHETGDFVVILVEKPDDKRIDTSDLKNQHAFMKSKRAQKETIAPLFKRLSTGTDLLMEWTLSLTEALFGYDFAIRHLDDRIVRIKSKPGKVTSSGDTVIVKGEGMPEKGRPMTKGDLLIKFSVVMPENIEPDAAAQLKALLPQPPKLPDEMAEEEYVTEPFTEANARAKAQRDRSRQHEMHDEDEEEHEGPQAQCRAQ